MLGWIYLDWCCWHVCSCPESVDADSRQGTLQKMPVASVIMEFVVWECGQTVLVKTCFPLMILASDQGRLALLHGATAGFWQDQARVVQAGTCRGPAVPEARPVRTSHLPFCSLRWIHRIYLNVFFFFSYYKITYCFLF